MNSLKASIRLAMLRRTLHGRFQTHNVRIITSTPRSGSTLFSQLFGCSKRCCVLFEPLHLNEVPEAKRAGFDWHTYREADADWPEGKDFFLSLFEGRLANHWMLREAASLAEVRKADTLIIKFVRANRLLPWLCNQFDLRPPIQLLRHPCGVIASQMSRSWVNTRPPEPPAYLHDFPVFRELLGSLRTEVEMLAATWALDQLPAFLYGSTDRWRYFTYEEILQDTEETVAAIIDLWGLDADLGSVTSAMDKPSSVVGSGGIQGLAGWKKTLSPAQVQQIMRVVQSFGLDFYDIDGQVDVNKLNNEYLGARIRDVGCR
ncbi:MAG: sulfotransferase [Pseudomonadota bacterium]